MAGLTAAGFEIKRLADIRQDMNDRAKSPPPDGFGAGVDVGEDSPLGQLIGLVAVELADTWAAAGQVYDSFDPDEAGGDALNNVGAVTAINRLGSTQTRVELTLAGTNGTSIPANNVVRVPSGPRFLTETDVVIGVATTTVDALAEDVGPIDALAGTVTEIVTPIAGWDSVTNIEDGAPGRLVENDTAYRLRREASLQIVGTGPTGAIRSRILEIEDVLATKVLNNTSAVVDADGVPGHSFRAVVWSGSPPAATDEDIIEAVFLGNAAGILADGSISGTVNDGQGIPQTISYSQAVELDTWIEVVRTFDDDYPIDGDDQIKTAAVNAISVLSVGDDIIVLDLTVAVGAVPGLLTAVVRVKIGGAPAPTDVGNIDVANTEIATIDILNVAVTP